MNLTVIICDTEFCLHYYMFYFGLASKLSVRGKKYAKVKEEKKGTPVKK